MATVTVLGAGMMASALCVPLADRGHDVRLVGTHLDGPLIDRLLRDHHHLSLKTPLPETIRPFYIEQLEEAMEGAEFMVVGVSSAGAEWAGQQLAPYVSPSVPILSITKGLAFDEGEIYTMPEVIQDEFDEVGEEEAEIEISCVVGPCVAGELARRAESCVVFTGYDLSQLERLQEAFTTDYYQIRLSQELLGNEVCAALKNAYALAIGFAGGLHERRGGKIGSVALHNYEAAVFSQAIVEMQWIVRLLGGSEGVVLGLAGAGDLMVTCNGGRTGRFGRLLGLGLDYDTAVERMEGATLESVEVITTLARALPDLEDHGLVPDDVPLLKHLIEVVVDKKPVKMPFGRFDFGL